MIRLTNANCSLMLIIIFMVLSVPIWGSVELAYLRNNNINIVYKEEQFQSAYHFGILHVVMFWILMTTYYYFTCSFMIKSLLQRACLVTASFFLAYGWEFMAISHRMITIIQLLVACFGYRVLAYPMVFFYCFFFFIYQAVCKCFGCYNSNQDQDQQPYQLPDPVIYNTIIPPEGRNLDTTCSICFDEFESHQSVCKLNCHHIYHPNCIGVVFRMNPICPICRAPIMAVAAADAAAADSAIIA